MPNLNNDFADLLYRQTLWWRLAVKDEDVSFETSPLMRELYGLEFTEYHDFIELLEGAEKDLFIKAVNEGMVGEIKEKSFVLALSIGKQEPVSIQTDVDAYTTAQGCRVVWGRCFEVSSHIALEKELVNIGGRSALREVELKAQQAENEQRLIQQKYEQQTQFLAMLSHELRSPLIGMSTLIKQNKLNFPQEPEIQSLFSMLGVTAEQLIFLVNDIQTFSQNENQRLVIQESDFDLSEMLDYVRHLTKSIASEKDIFVSFMVEGEQESYLGDVVRISQIMINLIVNAIKFTKYGGVAVLVKNNKDELVFRISDSGEGMSNEDLQKIFSPFAQLETSVAQNYLGTGLGLSIVNCLVSLMKGKVDVQSTKGVGTVFEVTLPLNSDVAENTKSQPEEQELKILSKELGYSILIADDSLINRKVLQQYLQELGCQVEAVENGLEALTLYSDNRFDFIFLDMQMPVMDGMETVKRMHEKTVDIDEPRLKGVFALTAAHTESELKLAGIEIDKELFDAWLLKPISQDQLLTLLEYGRYDRLQRTPNSHAANQNQVAIEDIDLLFSVSENLQPLMPQFLEAAELELHNLQLCLEALDWSGVKAAAHKFKGSCMMFELNVLVDELKQIEGFSAEKRTDKIGENLYNIQVTLLKIKDKYLR